MPLGPFLGKNFGEYQEQIVEIYSKYAQSFAMLYYVRLVFLKGTSISPWIVTLEALEPFKCEALKQVRFDFH